MALCDVERNKLVPKIPTITRALIANNKVLIARRFSLGRAAGNAGGIVVEGLAVGMRGGVVFMGEVTVGVSG